MFVIWPLVAWPVDCRSTVESSSGSTACGCLPRRHEVHPDVSRPNAAESADPLVGTAKMCAGFSVALVVLGTGAEVFKEVKV